MNKCMASGEFRKIFTQQPGLAPRTEGLSVLHTVGSCALVPVLAGQGLPTGEHETSDPSQDPAHQWIPSLVSMFQALHCCRPRPGPRPSPLCPTCPTVAALISRVLLLLKPKSLHHITPLLKTLQWLLTYSVQSPRHGLLGPKSSCPLEQ